MVEVLVKKKLELEFIDSGNKKFRISLEDPVETLEEVDVALAMDNILENNIFSPSGASLVRKSGAKIVETKTTAFKL